MKYFYHLKTITPPRSLPKYPNLPYDDPDKVSKTKYKRYFLIHYLQCFYKDIHEYEVRYCYGMFTVNQSLNVSRYVMTPCHDMKLHCFELQDVSRFRYKTHAQY